MVRRGATATGRRVLMRGPESMDAALRRQNNGRAWRWCRRHRKPDPDCSRCRPVVRMVSNYLGEPSSAGCSPLGDWLDARAERESGGSA